MNRKNSETSLPPKKNFLGIPEEYSQFNTARVAIVSVPYERTSTFGKGSKKGPKAIIKASQEVELYDSKLQMETYREIGGISTLPPINVRGLYGKQLAEKVKEIVSSLLVQGKFVITIGGEHTSTVGAVYAHINKFKPLTIIQFDAHSDLRNSYMDDEWNHACAMARILDNHNGKLIQVGIRSESPEEPDIKRCLSSQVHTFYAHHTYRTSPMKTFSEIIKLADEKVYITFDCDVFDPSIIPATGTPEPGGLTWNWIDFFFEKLSKEREIVGFDVSELSPLPHFHSPQFTIAKLIYRILGYVALNNQ